MRGRWLAMAVMVIAAGGVACNRGAAQSKETATIVPPAAEITIVGCVTPAEPAAANATDANATKYNLTHATANASPENKTAPSGATSGASQPASSTYRLDASDAMLAPEAGHQVEIVAVVAAPDERPIGTAGASADKAPAPKLKVHTIRMVTATCP